MSNSLPPHPPDAPHPNGPPPAEGLVGPAPVSPEELTRWLQRHLNLRVPARAVCPSHQAPLQYLVDSFLRPDAQGPADLLVWANRGGGKTMLAAIATLLEALYRPPIRIRILGGSFDQSDRLAEYLREFLSGPLGALVQERMTRTRIRLAGEADIRMLAQSQRAVRGQHVQRIRCDEVDLFDPEVWRALQFATRSRGRLAGGVEVFSTLHRPGGLMDRLVETARAGKGFRLLAWCLWEVIERCPPGRTCRDCPLSDDCGGLARSGEGYFRIDDAIAIKARSSRAAWEAEMLCRGARRDWLVFGEFDPDLHVAPVEYCPEHPLYRAIDFGYTSPLVCLWVQAAPGAVVHVVDEYARARLGTLQHVPAIRFRDRGPIAATYVDPAGAASDASGGPPCTALLESEGIRCSWRASSVAEGLELIRAALAPAAGPPRLFIHPRCRELIRAFGAYHYPAPGAAGAPDAPVKDGPDHFLDALRYFFVNRMRPRQQVQRGRY